MGPPIERWCQVSVEMGPPIERRCQVSNPLIKRNPPKFINFRPAEVVIQNPQQSRQLVTPVYETKVQEIPNYWYRIPGYLMVNVLSWYLKNYQNDKSALPLFCHWKPGHHEWRSHSQNHPLWVVARWGTMRCKRGVFCGLPQKTSTVTTSCKDKHARAKSNSVTNLSKYETSRFVAGRRPASSSTNF